MKFNAAVWPTRPAARRNRNCGPKWSFIVRTPAVTGYFKKDSSQRGGGKALRLLEGGGGARVGGTEGRPGADTCWSDDARGGLKRAPELVMPPWPTC